LEKAIPLAGFSSTIGKHGDENYIKTIQKLDYPSGFT
jgi:hypothetical protein